MIEVDEAFERELFAMRELPQMKLDVEDVFARAARMKRTRPRPRAPLRGATSWIGAAACVAASVFGVAQVHEPDHAAQSVELRGDVSDGLSCRSDVSEALANADDSMCFAPPSSLVCGRDVTFSVEKP